MFEGSLELVFHLLESFFKTARALTFDHILNDTENGFRRLNVDSLYNKSPATLKARDKNVI